MRTTMTAVPDRSTFESAYAGQAPWDIGGPQKAFIDMADRITGSILDTGCGTRENALFFVSRGHRDGLHAGMWGNDGDFRPARTTQDVRGEPTIGGIGIGPTPRQADMSGRHDDQLASNSGEG
jgi:hypothetical protein